MVTSVYRWWTRLRQARTLVPINDLKPSDIRECKTVPLAFAQAPDPLIRRIRSIYKLFFMGSRAPKQPFACESIMMFGRNTLPIPHGTPLTAGDTIRIILDSGESGTHLLRSASLSSSVPDLLLAVVMPNTATDTFQQAIRCIWVRHPATLESTLRQGPESTMLEWKVITPSIVGASPDYELERSLVPGDAIWLYIEDQSRPPLARGSATAIPMSWITRLPSAYGCTWSRGLLSLTVKTLSVALLMYLAIRYGSILDWIIINAPLFGLLVVAAVLGLVVYVTRRITPPWLRRLWPAMFGIESPFIMDRPKFAISDNCDLIAKRLLWYGSSRRALAIGDHFRKVARWPTAVPP